MKILAKAPDTAPPRPADAKAYEQYDRIVRLLEAKTSAKSIASRIGVSVRAVNRIRDAESKVRRTNQAHAQLEGMLRVGARFSSALAA